MSEHQDWSRRRRARNAGKGGANTAIALCKRQLDSGAIAEASRLAVLAHRLIRLEFAHAELQRKRAYKEAMERHRAEAALEEARKAVASLGPPPPTPTVSTAPASPVDDAWRERLARIKADLSAQQSAKPQIGSQPVQNPPRDSC
ncbi:MAG: hypothetical protein HY054_14835 [Proteobacteria bacterium]|nr:hypothetical protein [Pseudomonadota bacterium]